MTDGGVDWLGEHPSADAVFIGDAPGGSLSEVGRQAAVEASLALLGMYFAGGDLELSDQTAIAFSNNNIELETLHAGLRLRVALAAASRLIGLLDEVVRRPTFRYELRRTEHMGSLGAALDVNRWVTRHRDMGGDLSFPVVEVDRGSRTPENTLACYAAMWLMKELRTSLLDSLATSDTVEHNAVRQARARLDRSVRVPALASCRKHAEAVRTRTAAQRLVSEVQRRLHRREITNPGPYRELTQWINDCLHGSPAVAPGSVDLAVYGARFDNKLYELWCLGALGRALALALNLPEPSINPAWRRNAPAYSFENFAGRIDVFFQKSLSSVDTDSAAQWRKSNGRKLGGIPDIVIRAHPTGKAPRYAVIDPKLRQRDRLPAEELYKILGYFQNFDIRPPTGAVLLYTTDSLTKDPDVFHDGADGTLMSLALNPTSPEEVTRTALKYVTDVVLRLIDYDAPVSQGVDQSDATTDDERAENVASAVKLAVEKWGSSHLAEIAPSRQRIETLVGEERWQNLSGDVQIMMATSDLIGHQLDPTADFSGPVIGMCAAIEYLLHETIVTPLASEEPERGKQLRTLGAVIDAVELACLGKGGPLHRDVRTHLLNQNRDLAAIAALIPNLRRMNSTYRIPAAHRQVVTRKDWQQLYRLVMGSETMFIHTYDALY